MVEKVRILYPSGGIDFSNSYLMVVFSTSFREKETNMRAIVVAGGKGQRLWPLTESTPKAMVQVAKKPIIQYHLEWLKREGVTDVTIACGHLGEVIREHLISYPLQGLRIAFSFEEQPLGRGGAAKKAFRSLAFSDQACVISQGDIISDVPLREAYRVHEHAAAMHGIVLTLILTPYRSRYGVVEVEQSGLVARFREKPRLPYWANTGTFIASPEFFNFLPDRGDEDATIEYLVAEKMVGSFCTNFYSRTVDTPKDIQEAEADLALPSLPHEEVF